MLLCSRFLYCCNSILAFYYLPIYLQLLAFSVVILGHPGHRRHNNMSFPKKRYRIIKTLSKLAIVELGVSICS
jgi:hypothetical protein